MMLGRVLLLLLGSVVVGVRDCRRRMSRREAPNVIKLVECTKVQREVQVRGNKSTSVMRCCVSRSRV